MAVGINLHQRHKLALQKTPIRISSQHQTKMAIVFVLLRQQEQRSDVNPAAPAASVPLVTGSSAGNQYLNQITISRSRV